MISTNPTILIAEDEEDLRELYTMTLSSKGYTVLAAENGKQALEWLEKKHKIINLIILDVVMPEMDGFETLAKIKKDDRFRPIPVIISTNLDNDEDKEETVKLGANEYFVKSQHTPAELAERVKSYVG